LELVVDDDLAQLQEQNAELASELERLIAENQRLTAIVAAKVPVEAAMATIKNMGAEIEVLRERVAGLMEERNIAVRAAKRVKH
jgi:hypothetical protein